MLRQKRRRHRLVLKDSIFLNELLMHWLGSLRNRLLFTEQSLSSNIFLIYSQKAERPLTEICSAWLWMCFKKKKKKKKKQVRHRLRQLRSGPAHTPSSLHSIRQRQSWKRGCQCICSLTHTHAQLHTHTWRNGGSNWTGSGDEVLEARFVNPTLHHAWQR